MKHKHELFAPSWNTKKYYRAFTGILDHEDRGHPSNRRATKSLGSEETHGHSYIVYAVDGLLPPISVQEKETSFLFKPLVFGVFVICKWT